MNSTADTTAEKIATIGAFLSRRATLRMIPAGVLALLEGCGGSASSPAAGELRFERSLDLGLAYANSSINASIFRQQSILALSDGSHAVAYFDAAGEACIDVLSTSLLRLRSIRIDPPIERRLLADGHCSINLGYSFDERVHFIYGAHGTLPIQGSIAQSTLVEPAGPVRIAGAVFAGTITYPQFYRVGNELQFWYRSDPDSTIQFRRYDPAAAGFTATVASILAANGLEGPYFNQLAQLGRRLALSWMYRIPATDGIVRNEGLYLAISDDAGMTWQTRSGSPLAMPIERAALEPEIELPSTRQPLNQTSSCFSADGTLFVSYYAKDGNGAHQVYVARFGNDGPPAVEVVSDNTRHFDLTGLGTLTLSLSRPQVVASNSHVHLIYRQDGALIIASRDRAQVSARWTIVRHDVGDLGVWEPTCCRETWETQRRLLVYVQHVRQGARDTDDIGNPTTARVIAYRA